LLDITLPQAIYFLDEGWEVVDVHGKESYDLRCLGDGAEKHVEVKGTTTEGVEVILTGTRWPTPGTTQRWPCSCSLESPLSAPTMARSTLGAVHRSSSTSGRSTLAF
jgi:hypothetical protein